MSGRGVRGPEDPDALLEWRALSDDVLRAANGPHRRGRAGRRELVQVRYSNAATAFTSV